MCIRDRESAPCRKKSGTVQNRATVGCWWLAVGGRRLRGMPSRSSRGQTRRGRRGSGFRRGVQRALEL
eukprot:3589519-Alexandrium_andersonii.AAC.1